LHLEWGGSPAPLPLLRGVWGAALHDLDARAYAEAFGPTGPAATPGYLLRWSDARRQDHVDWLLFGAGLSHEPVLRRAWDVAGGRGLRGTRQPFLVRTFEPLAPVGVPRTHEGPWTLDRAAWPLPPDRACRVCFLEPLRLLRQGRLIGEPSLTDLVFAAVRRVEALLPPGTRPLWSRQKDRFVREARGRPSEWVGWRDALVRYSASQQSDLEMRGVGGILSLPHGVGPVHELLASALWLHLGKGTVFGLGRPMVLPDDAQSCRPGGRFCRRNGPTEAHGVEGSVSPGGGTQSRR
jgi:hypothetical protein